MADIGDSQTRAWWRPLSKAETDEFVRRLTVTVRPQVSIVPRSAAARALKSELVPIERVEFGAEFTASESPDGRAYRTDDEVTVYGALIEGERFCCDRRAEKWFVRCGSSYALLTGATRTSPFGQPSDDAQPLIVPDAPVRRLIVSELRFTR